MITFQELGLREELLKAITKLGFDLPMPVQEQVIPFVLNQENDLVALAQTGTGKTAAFGLPVLHLINERDNHTQALILSPTRELCIQIANDIKSYAADLHGFKVVPVYGGESIVAQYRQLDVQPQVLVATPGRLIDLIKRGKVKLNDVKFLVLDEADEMLNMGFKDDLETILESVPTERRTMLFSATMPKEIANIAKKYMRQASEISVGVRNSGAENVEHIYYMVQAKHRYLALKRIVDMNPDIYGIVFCRTRQETKDVAEKLMQDGYNADALHGDLSQPQRDTVMNKFRIKNLQLLVATDVAARGLDVSDLTHVINYNLPDDPEIYTHRSGRTGRANKSGISVSVVHSREHRRIKELEKIIKKEFKQQYVPDGLEICKKQLFFLIDKMENVQVNTGEIEQFLPQIVEKLSYLSKEELLSRFVSLEFNRFLEYYKNAPDINLPEHEQRASRSDRSERGERSGRERREKGRERARERGERAETRDRGDRPGRRNGSDGDSYQRNSQRGRRVRFKINVGTRNNVDTRSVLGIINDITNDKSISIGDIEITQRCTFFDVYADQADKVKTSFAGNGRGFDLTETEKNSTERQFRNNDRKRADRPERSDRPKKEYNDFARNKKREPSRSRNTNAPINSEKPWRRRR
ncbi:MAG: DEAD/DEAH box helicase [Prevotellaceae bacterium]|jgi:ATP-dependent RNA helicase DeaD|nr:DEAD/DEAH box helicase [Prevotellaceae bacterium]